MTMDKADIAIKAKGILVYLERFNLLYSKHQRESDEVLKYWANNLAHRNFTVKQIAFALNEISKKGSVFMPGVNEIVAVLVPAPEPKESRAEKIATEIHEAILDTLSGSKLNFIDELPHDTLLTIESLGGYRQLQHTDFNKDINRARLVKCALATLIAIENKNRNIKLSQQGILVNPTADLQLQQVDEPLLLKPVPAKETKNELQTFTASLEEVTKAFRETREAIPEEKPNELK